jgi:hypothetical protein
MAGLIPAIHVFYAADNKTWMPGTWASEATPFFERLWPGMTAEDRRSALDLGKIRHRPRRGTDFVEQF